MSTHTTNPVSVPVPVPGSVSLSLSKTDIIALENDVTLSKDGVTATNNDVIVIDSDEREEEEEREEEVDLERDRETRRERAIKMIKYLLRERYPERLLETVDELREREREEDEEKDKELNTYLELIGHTDKRYNNTHTPVALQFALSLCQVLSLDENTVDETEALKRTLLAQLGVREFSTVAEEKEWKDNSLSLCLTDIICKSCNQCRDIDLLRVPPSTQESPDIATSPSLSLSLSLSPDVSCTETLDE
eukprot:CAMPEP_0182422970 /NCGR_PEP_ID=MMETSP1167-20130531/8824_1 /TAXON_ID=2988 /ORGANISM="Mallomonas Sp, Strain CCMP3275" /LENGTH=248 /DNA_ID=CAMNT_0024601511 /DNA_START=174 /DNA_END=920 /DNA_ORIENTATION=+